MIEGCGELGEELRLSISAAGSEQKVESRAVSPQCWGECVERALPNGVLIRVAGNEVEPGAAIVEEDSRWTCGDA